METAANRDKTSQPRRAVGPRRLRFMVLWAITCAVLGLLLGSVAAEPLARLLFHAPASQVWAIGSHVVGVIGGTGLGAGLGLVMDRL